MEGSAGDDDFGLGFPGFGDEVFEFSAFVAAEGEAGEVVAFDPEVEVEVLGGPWEAVEGGGALDQVDLGGNGHLRSLRPEGFIITFMSDTAPTTEVDVAKKKRRRGCWIGVGVVVLVLAVWLGPVIRDGFKSGLFGAMLQGSRNEKYSASSQENLKAMYNALSLYHESEGQFPHAEGWVNAIETRIDTENLEKGEAQKKLIRPDLLGKTGEYGYAMNDAVSAKYKDDIKDKKTPLIFESKDTGKNAHGDPAKERQGWAISVDGTILKP